MHQCMARAAQRGQIVGGVGAAPGAGDHVVDLQEVGVGAAGSLAAVAVAGEDQAPRFRGNGGGVAVAGFADLGVASDALGLLG